MNNQTTILLAFFIFFFLGRIFLSLFSSSLFYFGRMEKSQMSAEKERALPVIPWLKGFLEDGWQNLFILIKFTKNCLFILYASCLLLFLLEIGLSKLLVLLFVTIFAIGENFFLYLSESKYYKRSLYLISFFSSVYLFLFFPLTNLLWIFSKNFVSKKKDQERILTALYDINVNKAIDPKFVTSLITFQERVVREVMIPRVKIFGLPADTTIRQASQDILSQGFSRIPVYKEKLDNIIGVLMYKDVLKAYVKTITGEEAPSLLDSPIETFINPVIYTPENKKIFQLFQEFRSKKTHLSIVVNEYGGTEGIITIEDILEELVGEIQDEYDVDEERQLWKLPNNTWIADAKLTIIDLEKKLNIHIPHSPEYETIGGFIFHKAGTIPKKGWSLLFDEFEIEVLISTDRCIEKIRITPIIPGSETKKD
jgi:putative hemolysin